MELTLHFVYCELLHPRVTQHIHKHAEYVSESRKIIAHWRRSSGVLSRWEAVDRLVG